MNRNKERLRLSILRVLESNDGRCLDQDYEREAVADALVAKLCPPKDNKTHAMRQHCTRTRCGVDLKLSRDERGYRVLLATPGESPTCVKCAVAEADVASRGRS